jgi:hypothetical protein
LLALIVESLQGKYAILVCVKHGTRVHLLDDNAFICCKPSVETGEFSVEKTVITADDWVERCSSCYQYSDSDFARLSQVSEVLKDEYPQQLLEPIGVITRSFITTMWTQTVKLDSVAYYTGTLAESLQLFLDIGVCLPYVKHEKPCPLILNCPEYMEAISRVQPYVNTKHLIQSFKYSIDYSKKALTPSNVQPFHDIKSHFKYQRECIFTSDLSVYSYIDFSRDVKVNFLTIDVVKLIKQRVPALLSPLDNGIRISSITPDVYYEYKMYSAPSRLLTNGTVTCRQPFQPLFARNLHPYYGYQANRHIPYMFDYLMCAYVYSNVAMWENQPVTKPFKLSLFPRDNSYSSMEYRSVESNLYYKEFAGSPRIFRLYCDGRMAYLDARDVTKGLAYYRNISFVTPISYTASFVAFLNNDTLTFGALLSSTLSMDQFCPLWLRHYLAELGNFTILPDKVVQGKNCRADRFYLPVTSARLAIKNETILAPIHAVGGVKPTRLAMSIAVSRAVPQCFFSFDVETGDDSTQPLYVFRFNEVTMLIE